MKKLTRETAEYPINGDDDEEKEMVHKPKTEAPKEAPKGGKDATPKETPKPKTSIPTKSKK